MARITGWIERLHPRDHLGRFVEKGSTTAVNTGIAKASGATNLPSSKAGRFGPRVGPGRVGARIGLSSATVSYSRSVRVGRKTRVVAGAYARLERMEQTKLQKTLERMTNSALRQIAESIPQRHIRRAATQIVEKRGRADIHGAKVRVSGGRNPAVRGTIAHGRRQTSGVRAPNRKPRTRSRQRKTTAGTRVR